MHCQALAKFASIIYTASELLGNRDLAASGLKKLEEAFTTFTTNQQINPLVYEGESKRFSLAANM